MGSEYDDWHREAAKDEFIACCCPNVDEPIVKQESRLWTCRCGWKGIPERTHNSGGATNYKYCPKCRNPWLSLKEDNK